MNAIVNANQHTTTLHYDALGRLARIAPEGHPDAAFEYDALGHVEKVSEPGPDGSVRETLLENNAFGRPSRVVHPNGAEESFKYDAHWRRVVESVDALGRTNAYDWVLGVPVLAKRFTASRPAGIPLFALSHDQQMNTLSISDPLGRRAESYVLDANERVVAVTNLEGQAMTREFLVGGVVGRIGRYDGSQVSFDYSGDGDLRTVAYPDGSLAFTYDRDGLLLTASGAAGTVANEYNEAAWLTKTRGVDGAEVAYGYHPAGQVSNVVTVAGSTGYALDAADRLSRIAAPSAAFDYAYNPWNGSVSAVTNGVDLVAEFQYDIMDRPTNIVWRKSNGSTLARFGYEYNALGMITEHARTVGTNEVATAYGYDDLDRLASETEASGVVRTYAYDLAGNRLSKTETGSTPITYALGVGDRLASYTGGAYTHNAAGCVTAIDRTGKPDLALTWNGQYQLTSVSTNGVVAETYAYDPLGRRASTTSGGVTVRHVYDGVHCAADTDATGILLRSYTWGPGIDNLLAVTCHSGSSATTYYALTDIQGTVHGFADAGGNLVARYAYDAWGNLLDADVAVSALADNRYLFQGREYSHATGLYNFRLRWYDPATGRWLSKDPIGISGGLNLYAFCDNDPVNSVDPWGLLSWASIGGGVARGIDSLFNGILLLLTSNPNLRDQGTQYGVHSEIIKSIGYPLRRMGAYDSDECELTPAASELANLVWDAGAAVTVYKGLGAQHLPPNGVIQSGAKPTPKFAPTTNPPQPPPSVVSDGLELWVGRPTQQYPHGYWRLLKPMPHGKPQGINPSTMLPGPHQDTHVPLPPGYWN